MTDPQQAGVTVGRDRDLTAEARIRRSALRLFAERGFAGTTTRAIGAAARVSPPLVLHYFGTKENLRDEVDRDVMATVDEICTAAATPPEGPVDFNASVAGYGRLFREHPYLTAYIRRSLVEPTTGLNGILARILAYIEELMDFWIDRGVLLRPTDKPATIALQASIGLTSILFEDDLAEYLGRDEPVDARIARAAIELWTQPHFTDKRT